MGPSIVVLIDLENKSVQLFGEHNRIVPFEDLYLLPVFLDGKEVLYVTQGEETDAASILELTKQLAESVELSTERRYFHTTQDGYLKVPDIKLTLAGKRDSKPVDQFAPDVFEKSAVLRKHIQSGIIEIITESQAAVLKKKLPNQRLRDQVLDDMIVKTSVHDVVERDDFFDDDDMITSEQGEVETETEQILKKISHLRKSE